MQEINESLLLAIYKNSSLGNTEVKILAKILLETNAELISLRKKVSRYENILVNRRSIPLTQEEIDEIHTLRLKYNKTLKEHTDEHNH
jgi:hypothetical protein|tara:strand:+ start:1587 stop:1850 length:264 start_codon:yes stop_codon:yes gene_type:complete